jgi:dienelactone hydrolase
LRAGAVSGLLFERDPALVAQALAAGLSVSEVVAALSATRPHYKYRPTHRQATELAELVVRIGATLTSTREKRDGEELALMRATHEKTMSGRLAGYPPRIAAAVDYALKQTDAATEHLGLVGLSLGGGLALDYAESAKAGKIKALVDYFAHISDPKIFANVERLPPTLILHNTADKIVKIEVSSEPLLDALKKSAVVHDHCFYDDANPSWRDHPFLPGGKADVDSRARSLTWLKTHLMPSS